MLLPIELPQDFHLSWLYNSVFFTIILISDLVESCMPFAAFITDYARNWACMIAKPLLSFGIGLRTNIINFGKTIKHCKELPFKNFFVGAMRALIRVVAPEQRFELCPMVLETIVLAITQLRKWRE